MTLSERVYRQALRLYPPGFRAAYGESMAELFEVRHARARGKGLRAVAGFWLEIGRDLLRTVAEERTEARAARRRNPFRKESYVDTFWQDLRQALRRLVDAPGFTALALLIVGLGIGANVAMFSVVESVLLRPPLWERPDRLTWIYQDSDDGEPNSCSYPAYLDIAAQGDVFEGVATLTPGRQVRHITPEGDAQLVDVAYVSSSLFPVLGLQPSRGSWLDERGDAPGADPTGVVSHRAWQTRFAADPDIVGRSVRLNGTTVTIVGVGPEGYLGEMMATNTDFWLSIAASGPVGGDFYYDTLERRGDHWFLVVGRLRDDVELSQAQAAMDVLANRLAEEFPEHNEGRDITVFRAESVRLHPEFDKVLFPAGAVLMGVVGLVLLIACGNLANLLLARATTRSREIAVRLAMGATRWRVTRQLLTESVVLSVAGGLVGLGFALLFGRLLSTAMPPLPLPLNLAVQLDARVLAFAFTLSVATGIVFGVAPSLRASRPDLVPGLKSGGDVGARSSRPRWLTLRNALVAGQVAVSFVLLIGSGLLVRSLLNAQSAPLGFSSDGLAVVQADPAEAGYESEPGRQLLLQLREQTAGYGGVESATLSSRLPATPTGGSSTLEVEGYDPPDGTGKAEVIYAYVDPFYFDTLRIPMREGRGIEATDRAETERVAVVNEAFAERYWGTTDVVNRRYRHEGAPDSWVRVVGVVADVKVRAPNENPTPMFYRPLAQGAVFSRLFLVARAETEPAELVRRMRADLRELDPNVPIYQAGTMSDHVSISLVLPRTAAAVLALFGGLALLLASLGLYAVVAFSVARRTAEMGIRMALGASRASVVTLMLKETLAVVGSGLVVGAAFSLLAAPLLESLLFGVSAADPMTFVMMALMLLGVATLASYLPARRAAAADPVRTLRFE